MIRKRIPDSEEGFDMMLQSLLTGITNYKPQLNISGDQIDALTVDKEAYHSLRLLKEKLRDASTGVTEFVNIMFGGDPTTPAPPAPNLSFSLPALPALAGIEKRVDRLIAYIEAQPGFTENMGLEMGFYVNESTAAPETLKAKFKVSEQSGYCLEISFSRQGQDGLRLQHRIKGATAWASENLLSSPFVLQVAPDSNGNAVTIELQAILLKKNQPVGLLSDMKTVVAHA